MSSSGCSWKRRVSSRAADGSRRARPARDAIERVPAVIEQDAAAGELAGSTRQFAAPAVLTATAGCIRSVRQRTDRTAPIAPSSTNAEILLADRALSSQLCTVWSDAPGARGGRLAADGVLHPCDQRLLAEHMQSRIQRPLDQRRVAARRRADIDEVEPLARDRSSSTLSNHRPSGQAARNASRRDGGGVGRGDDLDIVARPPPGRMPVGRDIAEADERAPQHGALSLGEGVAGGEG